MRFCNCNNACRVCGQYEARLRELEQAAEIEVSPSPLSLLDRRRAMEAQIVKAFGVPKEMMARKEKKP